MLILQPRQKSSRVRNVQVYTNVVWCLHLPSVTGNRHCFKEKSSQLRDKKKNHCASKLDACHHSFVDVRHVEDELDEVVDGHHFHPVVGSTRSAPSLDLKNG